jgi:hypothetical protein
VLEGLRFLQAHDNLFNAEWLLLHARVGHVLICASFPTPHSHKLPGYTSPVSVLNFSLEYRTPFFAHGGEERTDLDADPRLSRNSVRGRRSWKHLEELATPQEGAKSLSFSATI